MASVPPDVVRLVEDGAALIEGASDGEVAHAASELRRAAGEHSTQAAVHAQELAAEARRNAKIGDMHPDFEIADALLEAAKVLRACLRGELPAPHEMQNARQSLHRAQRQL